MKTPDKIKKGLEHCANIDDCEGCNYRDECMEKFNNTPLTKDVLAYIQQLEVSNGALRILMKKLEAKVPKWISVEERLPDESEGTILVCFPDFSPYNLKEPFVNAKHDGRVATAKYSQHSKIWYIGDMCAVGDVKPTHWMPLPEPPTEV